jgi:DNA-binding response OmpR family regulator
VRVLVIEDDQPLVRIMTKSLESNGFEVQSAFDGEEGLRLARDGWDSIVLDLQLPKLNGVELCKRLRAEGSGAAAGRRRPCSRPGRWRSTPAPVRHA